MKFMTIIDNLHYLKLIKFSKFNDNYWLFKCYPATLKKSSFICVKISDS